ncbi:MAG: NAD+ synthase [Gammaproteobacteria bacterium]|nr:NAD+ synthase [Gammaproteobacteria bacterium]
MSNTLNISMAQANPTVGDVPGNVDKVLALTAQAVREQGAELVIFPELMLTGYPPEDLLHHGGLRGQLHAGFERLLAELPEGVAVLLGLPEYVFDSGRIFNTAQLLTRGHVLGVYRKQLLPNYGVFDEKRYFVEGDVPCVVEYQGFQLGLTVCEDLWHPGVARQTADAGADVLLNVSASPFQMGRQMHREAEVLKLRVEECGLPIVYVNLVGGQDELVFDGGSLAVSRHGRAAVRSAAFDEVLTPVRLRRENGVVDVEPGEVHVEGSQEESVYKALVMGVRDYVNKNGFPGALLGLSGGIDSGLTLAIAVDALGADKVTAVMMPSQYTSDISTTEAARQAEMLGVTYHSIAIEKPVVAFEDILASVFEGLPPDTTEENIQARSRGVILMALSNKSGDIVLTTGNKSEMAVGYATLYGDMAGGFAALKDVPKTLVYRLAKYRNGLSPAIPEVVITRPPSAELRPDQKDSDSLPDYDTLDAILEAYVEDDLSVAEVVARGFDRQTVERVVGLVQRNEYKRRQAPPGVKISRRAFGRERRYPITSGYRHQK